MLKGWDTLRKQAQSIPKQLRTWRFGLKTKTGKIIWVRYPRIKILTKSKLGRLDTFIQIEEKDMASIENRVSPEEFKKYQERIRENYHGITITIQAMSQSTCQATGKTGATQIVEKGGWVRTLLPSVAKKLKLKEKTLSSYIHPRP